MPKGRKATLKKRTTNTRSDVVFVIACEGQETETIYFLFIREWIKRTNEDFPFRVVPLGAQGGDSKPKDVLKRMDNFIRDNGLTKKDHAWLVMDVDHHTHSANLQNLNTVMAQATGKSYRIALSNACFEVWLMLHLTDTVPAVLSTQMERAMKNVMPDYDKSNYQPSKLAHGVPTAIQRAKVRDSQPGSPIPLQAGTRVYQLMESLRAAIINAGGTSPF